MMSYQIQTDITKSGIKLLLEEPFFGHIFSAMLRSISSDVESISISVKEGMPSLTINPIFWNELPNSNEKFGLLKHQLLHFALKHPFMKDAYHHKHIFDMAADLVVNQYIHSRHLSEDAITLDKYPKLKKLEKGREVGYYYQKILELQKNDPNNQLPEEGNSQSQQHQDWSQFNQMPRMDQRMMESALEDNLVRAAERSMEKLQGLLPGSLFRLIQEKIKSGGKQLDWKRVLRIFLGNGRKTYIKNTIRRPSKRYGTSPGIQIKQRQKILVGLDTSGSVSPEELAVFFGEMHHIQKQGAEILVAECDSKIQRTYLLGSQSLFEVKGGGGTDFNPVLEFANEEYHPDAIVYFTDGHANKPDNLPKCPILWLISKDGINEEMPIWKELKGRKVKMA